ncbi:IS256 family transposase [Carboxydothermus pertinax]|uniref:IS256 family transposase n=1 Tax=Carboxydothermus pertinax TaxID=870242 RepID=A0A1L8CX81_9THEO|nr:IS256 family transposase [Carboxydothermus pertinax]
MAQYNITIDSEILHHLFLNGAKDEGVAKLLESVLNQILQAQAKEQIKADPYERNDPCPSTGRINCYWRKRRRLPGNIRDYAWRQRIRKAHVNFFPDSNKEAYMALT